jgi:plasmid stabilization system protein ParE
MTPRFRLTKPAIRDIEEIAGYIARLFSHTNPGTLR